MGWKETIGTLLTGLIVFTVSSSPDYAGAKDLMKSPDVKQILMTNPAPAAAFHESSGEHLAQMDKGIILIPKKEQVRQKSAKPAPTRSLPVSPGEYIPCPLERVTIEVTTDIASPWWNTPQIGEVERVDVINVGGSPALVCAYRAYNDVIPVIRNFPAGKTSCVPEGKGFLCK